jgi:excisionase family DNA binding protein
LRQGLFYALIFFEQIADLSHLWLPVVMRFLRRGGNMDEYLTIFEVAELTKYTVGTLRKYVLKRLIPFHKWGRSLRFRRSEIELWIKSGCAKVVYLPEDGGKPETEGSGGKGSDPALLFPEAEA